MWLPVSPVPLPHLALQTRAPPAPQDSSLLELLPALEHLIQTYPAFLLTPASLVCCSQTSDCPCSYQELSPSLIPNSLPFYIFVPNSDPRLPSFSVLLPLFLSSSVHRPTVNTALIRLNVLTSCSHKSELLHPHICACCTLKLRVCTSQNLPIL